MIHIAIDGPAGAGKSTVAKYIAKRLGILYLDTGAMYRALALKALSLGLEPKTDDMTPVLGSTVDIRYADGAQLVYLDGENVTEQIREHRVSGAASDISKIKEVRLKLVELQRGIAEKNNVVMDGRDIGTYVLPKANVKFYLTAAPEIRAKRRCEELKAKGERCDFQTVLKDIVERDKNDSTREFAPLRQAEDAILIDTSYMSFDEVCCAVLEKIRA